MAGEESSIDGAVSAVVGLLVDGASLRGKRMLALLYPEARRYGRDGTD